MCPADPCEHSPHAPKFEDSSQEETERQERCARGDTWRLAKHKFKLPAPSETKMEDREFVVESGTSMHMLSKRDLNSAEWDTVQVPKKKNPLRL